jgi:hypothetical protein
MLQQDPDANFSLRACSIAGARDGTTRVASYCRDITKTAKQSWIYGIFYIQRRQRRIILHSRSRIQVRSDVDPQHFLIGMLSCFKIVYCVLKNFARKSIESTHSKITWIFIPKEAAENSFFVL